ncbi:PAAR domain-containing protein [Psychrobacter aestuarii]|uniref:PAAR domain-containing protein n=1 Tax=Psychrobacter aestuarii TaxID=556327 RepID=A0ABN0VKH2_9GAMM|nr:PAAR domain-containing protein [Psychrobacter aestuarii]
MAAYITVGAKTSHGGTVITGSPHTTHNGIPIARIGDKVICKKCKKITTIVSGDPAFVVDGAPIARGGDATSCGAKLIATQQSFMESGFDVMGIEPPEPLQFPKSKPDDLLRNDLIADDTVEENIDRYAITNLGEDIDKIAAHSPTLQEHIRELQEDGWDIQYGPDAEGTYVSYDEKRIIVSEYYKNSPTKAMHAFTHEVGHATYPGEIDISSKEAYVNSKLTGEGGAVNYSTMIRQEVLENGNIDILGHVDSKDMAVYTSIYNEYGDTEEAWEQLGQYWSTNITSTTGEHYDDFYARRYDEGNY